VFSTEQQFEVNALLDELLDVPQDARLRAYDANERVVDDRDFYLYTSCASARALRFAHRSFEHANF
jgi:hypothetical protein